MEDFYKGGIKEIHYKKNIRCGHCNGEGGDTKICPHCGKELVFNQIGTGTYCEQGYLDQWSNYTKWLMGTMHKKVVLLELGVGPLEFPVCRSGAGDGL